MAYLLLPCREKDAGTVPPCREKEIRRNGVSLPRMVAGRKAPVQGHHTKRKSFAEMAYLFLAHAWRKAPVKGHHAERKRSQKWCISSSVWLLGEKRRYKATMQRERDRRNGVSLPSTFREKRAGTRPPYRETDRRNGVSLPHLVAKRKAPVRPPYREIDRRNGVSYGCRKKTPVQAIDPFRTS
jgi:hypothetical protein